jgi:hypothetical protein
MQHLDEGTIHAWLDDELPAAERAAAEGHVAQCPECAAAVAEARGFIAASSRILTALDAMPGGVLPATQVPAKRFMIPRAWMAVAAVLVLGIGTVIATRYSRDVAALRVAETRQEVKPANAAPPAAESVAQTIKVPAAPARSAKSGAALPADKLESHVERARKEAGAVLNDSTPLMIADAARAANAGMAADYKGALRPQAPAATRAAAPSSAPASFADTARPRALALQQVVVTGAGVESPRESGDAEPRIVSRDSATRGADTTVTTIYDVRGVRVTLTDRTSRMELKRSPTNFSDALAAKARAQAPAENSISWSDSTGRTRTLRGAISQAELERLKARLFGATP